MAQQKVVIKVQGMSCSSCSNNVQKKLNATGGIINATINIATEKGQVEYESEKIDVEGILEAVAASGYRAIAEEDKDAEKVTLKVKGMSCTACANLIEKSLSKTDGIEAANVNFAAEKLTVEYDPKKIRLIEMQKKSFRSRI
ncbi:MAG: copper ion binding protein [Bacillaceae bacterium]|nr:copper ion binding protein [Bacillaceae bacterium]